MPNVRNQTLYGGMGSDTCTPEPCREPGTNLTAPFAYLDRTNPIAIEPVLPDPMLIVAGGLRGRDVHALEQRRHELHRDRERRRLARDTRHDRRLHDADQRHRQLLVRRQRTEGRRPDVVRRRGRRHDDRQNGRAERHDDRPRRRRRQRHDHRQLRQRDARTPARAATTYCTAAREGDALLALGTGGDRLFAEDGNDQIATSDPCQGHVYRGGEGQDVAGFARTTSPINATIGDPNGDPGTIGSSWYGAAFVRAPEGNNACAGGAVTWVGADNEILEGTNHDDVLTGNQDPTRSGHGAATTASPPARATTSSTATTASTRSSGRPAPTGSKAATAPTGSTAKKAKTKSKARGTTTTLWGESGNDSLFGGTEADELFGGAANDLVDGGAGVDRLFGQEGNDRLRARDGTADGTVNCGPDADEAVEADPFDPVINC